MATARKPPVTIPCKYRTGKVLGNGTYATVKGEKKRILCNDVKFFLLFSNRAHSPPEAMHVSFICL